MYSYLYRNKNWYNRKNQFKPFKWNQFRKLEVNRMMEITPSFDDKSSTPLYVQLADYIKKEILAGRIRPYEKLPSKRKLSTYLGLSINTIQAAYDQLSAEGYIISKQRKGVFVTKLEEELFLEKRIQPTEDIKTQSNCSGVKIDFNSGKVDLEHFPFSEWKKLTLRSMYEDQGALFYSGDPQGEIQLREQIAKYLFASRGVKCTPEQIVIGAGTQSLVSLLYLMLGKEHAFALEDPGFHRTRVVLKDLGALLHHIPLDEDGIKIDCLNESAATVVYVTPSHQFPCGMVMPIQRRMELLKWAEENGGYIIEDDYDGEYRYKGKPIPSLQGLDKKGRVIYLGTFSKSLIPSIRISYLVLPKTLIRLYQEHFMIYKQQTSRLHQNTIYHFMDEGIWHRHLNKMRTLYRKKQAVLVNTINEQFGDAAEVIGEKSGLHILLKIENKMSEDVLISKALEAGVKVYPLSIYYAAPQDIKETKILLGFGGLSLSEIKLGIKILKEAWGI